MSQTATMANIGFANALDPAVAPLLEPYNWDAAASNAGRALVNDFNTTMSKQVLANGAHHRAVEDCQAKEATARDSVSWLRKVARVEFAGDTGTLAALGLSGALPPSRSQLITAGLALCDNAVADPACAAKLATCGAPAAKITEVRGTVTALIEANRLVESTKGDAQLATAEQNQKLAELEQLYARFRKIARLALAGKPQLLEKLGILDRNVRTPAQRNAPKKAAETRKKNKKTEKPEPVGV